MMWIVAVDLQEYSCGFGSNKYFALCGLGGIISCGTTHTAVVPLDLVKCRIQVDPAKYGGIIKGFRVSLAEAGLRELGKGWAPTFFGYSMQGLGKFGLYEVFKIYYSMAIGEVNIVPSLSTDHACSKISVLQVCQWYILFTLNQIFHRIAEICRFILTHQIHTNP